MAEVFFIPLDAPVSTDAARAAGQQLLQALLASRPIEPGEFIPLKVHFGEKGNHTFLPASCYDGIIDLLESKEATSAFVETNALYSGARMRASDHMELAHSHGFTRLPVQIADGEEGGDYEDIEIAGKHFRRCKIGKGLARQDKLVVISHFKGHRLAGFGGALKQLAMGFASRGGKLEQHANSKPTIRKRRCTGCGACVRYCPVTAIRLVDKRCRIDEKTCIGCAGCMSACRQGAIFFSILRTLFAMRHFGERLTEYAAAAQQGKHFYYITFIMNITRGCDCEGKKMEPFVPDLGALASLDPVAIDQAALDLLDQRAGSKVFRRGRGALAYGESLGMGSRDYQLTTLDRLPASSLRTAAGR